jgi:uncharacterized repeat protein (TIGR02543 family)
MKKKFTIGLIALLSVSFIFFGCGDSGGGGGGLGETTYTVTYNGNENDGGTAPTDSGVYNLGDTVTVLASGNLTKGSDLFNGWDTLADGTGESYAPGDTFEIDGNIVLFAQWVDSSTTYTVTYNGNTSDGGGVPVDGSTYAPLAPVTVLGNTGSLTKSGSVFGGWNTAADGTGTSYAAAAVFNINANITLYARWIAPLTVTYDGNGSDAGVPVVDSNEYAPGATVTVESNTFGKTDSLFNGWNTAANGSGTPYLAGDTFPINAATTLYAQWVSSSTTYTVTYAANGASGDVPTDGTAYVPLAPVTVSGNTGPLVKTGYVFNGWNTEANGTGKAYAGSSFLYIDADTTLYAQWLEIVTAGAIVGVTPPVLGGTPVPSVSGTGYTGAITWDTSTASGAPVTFAGEVIYVATITLTPAAGYTFEGATFANFDVAGVDASKGDGGYTAGLAKPTQVETNGKVIIKAWFPKTAPAVITAVELFDVEVPATGGTPAGTVSGTGYDGTIDWDTSTASGAPVTFAAGTIYVATITLTPKTGYTFDGFQGAFTVAGTDSTKNDEDFTAGLKQELSVDDWVVTAWFPATALAVITTGNLSAATITKYATPPNGSAVGSPAGDLTISVKTSIASGLVALAEGSVDQGINATAFDAEDTQLITITLYPAAKHTFVGAEITAEEVVAAVLDETVFPGATLDGVSGGPNDPFVVTVTYTKPYVVIASGDLTDISAKYDTAPTGNEVTDGTLTVGGSLASGLVTLAEGSVDQGSNPSIFDAGDTQVVTITLTAAAGYTFTDTEITADDVVNAALGSNVTGGLGSPEIDENTGDTLVVIATYTKS